jgi:GNAT superfamily N-acetyltransferase
MRVKALDEVCFPADVRVATENVLWWITWLNGEAVAYAGLRVCRESFNRGLAFLCRAGVRPEHRGHGLQRRMIEARVAYARKLGIRELVTYVVPDNLASANSLIACGFKLYRPEHRWGGSAAMYFRMRLAQRRGGAEEGRKKTGKKK